MKSQFEQGSWEHEEDLEGLEDAMESGADPAPAPAWPARELSVIRGFFKTYIRKCTSQPTSK